MTLFSLLESLFFMSLALAFFLIFLMVYHFKQRIDALDRKNEMLGDICKTLVKEIDMVKETTQTPPPQSFFPNTQPSFTFQSFPEPEELMMSDDYNPLQHLFAQLKQAHNLQVYDDDCEELECVVEEVLEEPLEESAMAEESVMTQESVMTESAAATAADKKISKQALKKMTIVALRNFAIQEGYCTDPSKIKKKELIDMILAGSDHHVSEIEIIS